jgi:hypothetical protein
MIPQGQQRVVHGGGATNSVSFDISHEDVAHIMGILRDTLYSDKVMAVLREYSANAWDAHRSVGKGDVPIKVTLPTLSDPTLSIRDYGPGLSVEEIGRVFTKYGKSTKRDDNVAVGMLGIGSKSGFAYSDSFTITSWHGGRRYEYVAIIDASEKGKCDLLFEEAIDGKPETGLEIKIAVNPRDISEFTTKAQSFFAYFDPPPVINTFISKFTPTWDAGDAGKITTLHDYYNNSKWVVLMGCVPYRVDLGQLRAGVDGEGLPRCVDNIGGVLHAKIGDVQIAASREELKYGESTKLFLIRAINGLIDKYVEHLLDGVDQLSQWEQRIRVKELGRINLPIPTTLAGMHDSYIYLNNIGADWKIQILNWRGKLDGSSSVAVDPSSEFLLKDERKLMAGYKLQRGQYVVSYPAGLTPAAAKKELTAIVQKFKMEGIPIKLLSSVPWAKPLSGPRATIDSQKARAAVVIFDPTQKGADRKSEAWKVDSIVPSDDDVYVVLESYRVTNLDDFYYLYSQDERLATGVGLTMPKIVGYRRTKNTPVDRSKLKGTDYKDWREKKFREMLLELPEVQEAAKAMAWAHIDSIKVEGQDLEKQLGADHPLTIFGAAIQDARKALGKLSGWPVTAAKYAVPAADAEPRNTREGLLATYPLFNTAGGFVALADHTYGPRWYEYVKLVDMVEQLTAPSPQPDAV